MQSILGAIKNLQVIVHMALLHVVVPANSAIMYGEIKTSVAFDLVDVGDYTTDIMKLNEEENEITEPRYTDLGYDSNYFVLNMGSLFYVFGAEIALIPVIVVSTACLSRCKGRRSMKANKWFKAKQDAIFFNTILTSIDAALIVVVLSATINIKNQTGDKDFSYFIAVVCLGLSGLQLILMSIFFMACKKNINEERYTKRCGSVYAELNTSSGWALSYPIVYQLRFFVFVLIAMFLSNPVI